MCVLSPVLKMNPLFHRRTKLPAPAVVPGKLISKPKPSVDHSIDQEVFEPVEVDPVIELDPSWSFSPTPRSALNSKQDLLASVNLTADENRERKLGAESEVLVLQDFDDDFIVSHEDLVQNRFDLNVNKTEISSSIWRQLKNTVFGTKSDTWEGQGFEWNENVALGFKQRKGGPCGVLAAVQAFLIRDLLLLSTGTINNADEIKSKRTKVLSSVLSQIIWRCSDKTTAKICFMNKIGADLFTFTEYDQIESFVQTNITKFNCINFVYSIVLSRGLEQTALDMDYPSSLITCYGYCTQELVNLIITGRANSNTFDGELELGGKILRGIQREVDVGLLSLEEANGDCVVGCNLKTPRNPIYLVCSESHYSILFSKTRLEDRDSSFDLFYYDQLAGQEDLIHLTIRKPGQVRHHKGLDEPPLEKCIRTKWTDVAVDWNGYEPIL